MKAWLIILLILQVSALSGPVCGNHLTTAESMDCCKKGHHQDGTGLQDPHSAKCCATCDMGKAQGTRPHDSHHLVVQGDAVPVQFIEVEDAPFINFADAQQFSSPSPPDIFLLDRSIRI